MLTDENLALKAQENDYESEIELFARYKNLVSKISRSFFLVGGDPEDIIQEGMIGLYKAIKNYDKEKNATFSTFAFLCIRRQIQSAIKVASSKRNMMLSKAIPIVEEFDEDDEPIGLVIPSTSMQPDDQMISKETMQEVKQKIEKSLSKMELLILRQYLKGQSYDEISKQLDINKKSVDNALSRIKNKLSFLKSDMF